MTTEDLSTPDYWNALYLKNDTGWDKGQCSPPIARMLKEGLIPKGGKVAVIGAGRGHEAIEAARLGFEVSSIDFAEQAARAVAEAAKAAGVKVEVLQQDLFTLPKRRSGHYDAVIEQTCFCAIDVQRRPEYVEVVHALLKKGGVLFGLFYAPGKPVGPPFDTSEEELRRLFAARFELTRLGPATDSFAQRAGNEFEAVFTAR